MLVLALDSALSAAQAAVLSADEGGEAVLASLTRPMVTGQAEALVPLVEEALRMAGCRYGDIGCLAVTIGPGTFAGVRIALSAARALRLALQIPLAGVTTVAALANPHLNAGAPVAAAIDARRGDVYFQLFANDGTPLTGPAALDIADAAALLPAGRIRVAGSGANLLAAHRPDVEIVSVAEYVPIDAVARIAARMNEPASVPAPLYLRPPDAKPQMNAALARR